MAKSIDEQIQDVQDVIQKTTNATTKKYAEERLKVLEASKSAGAEGVIYDTLQQLQTLLNQGVGQGTVDQQQVKDIADNVGYSIKTNYVLNLIDILPKSIDLPSSSKLANLPLTEQIKEISKYVVLVKVK